MAGDNPQTTMPPTPREDIIDSKGRMSNQWKRWLDQVQRILSFAGGIAWQIVNKGGSKLSDIETRPHSQLQSVEAWASGDDASSTKHISNAQGKKWQDHVLVIDGNPHGTDHSQLDGIDTDTSAAAIHHTLGTGANQAAPGNHGHLTYLPVLMPEKYRAIGDGEPHALSTQYGSLAAAQAAFPLCHAAGLITTLTDYIDWAAIQECILSNEASGGMVWLSFKKYVTNRKLVSNNLTSDWRLTIRGQGRGRDWSNYVLGDYTTYSYRSGAAILVDGDCPGIEVLRGDYEISGFTITSYGRDFTEATIKTYGPNRVGISTGNAYYNCGYVDIFGMNFDNLYAGIKNVGFTGPAKCYDNWFGWVRQACLDLSNERNCDVPAFSEVYTNRFINNMFMEEGIDAAGVLIRTGGGFAIQNNLFLGCGRGIWYKAEAPVNNDPGTSLTGSMTLNMIGNNFDQCFNCIILDFSAVGSVHLSQVDISHNTMAIYDVSYTGKTATGKHVIKLIGRDASGESIGLSRTLDVVTVSNNTILLGSSGARPSIGIGAYCVGNLTTAFNTIRSSGASSTHYLFDSDVINSKLVFGSDSGYSVLVDDSSGGGVTIGESATPAGTIHGAFQFRNSDGTGFDATNEFYKVPGADTIIYLTNNKSPQYNVRNNSSVTAQGPGNQVNNFGAFSLQTTGWSGYGLPHMSQANNNFNSGDTPIAASSGKYLGVYKLLSHDGTSFNQVAAAFTAKTTTDWSSGEHSSVAEIHIGNNVGGTSLAASFYPLYTELPGLKIGTLSTVGQVWTATDSSGNGSWQPPAGGGLTRVYKTTGDPDFTASVNTHYTCFNNDSITVGIPDAVSGSELVFNGSPMAGSLSFTTTDPDIPATLAAGEVLRLSCPAGFAGATAWSVEYYGPVRPIDLAVLTQSIIFALVDDASNAPLVLKGAADTDEKFRIEDAGGGKSLSVLANGQITFYDTTATPVAKGIWDPANKRFVVGSAVSTAAMFGEGYWIFPAIDTFPTMGAISQSNSAYPIDYGYRSLDSSGSPVAVTSGTVLRRILAGGYDGATYVSRGASLWFVASGTWSSTNRPSRFYITTNPAGSAGSANGTERFGVGDDGEITFGAATALTVGMSGVTPDGGQYTCYLADENLTAGDVAHFTYNTGSADGVTRTPTSNDRAIGIVYAGVSSGQIVKVVNRGRVAAYFDAAPIKGSIAIVDTAAVGRLTSSNAPDASVAHWRECGHPTGASVSRESRTLYYIDAHFN